MSFPLQVATADDVAQLRALDRVCFPPGDACREPAAPNELENAVADGRVRIVRDESANIVGFIQYEMPTDHHVYISGLGVHPDRRGNGLGGALIDGLLKQIPGTDSPEPPSISTVSSPENLDMLGLLFSRGFVVRRSMHDYFGPGKHRYYFQYKIKVEYVDPDEKFIVPAAARDHISSLLASERYVITGLAALPAGPALEISRFERDDFAALQSNETSAGIAFASGILAAVTFLLGLSFTSVNYPDAVRIVLMGAALATTVSLVIYANTSGELARLRTNVFSHHMKWGNVLSEYGGVYPLLISLPVAFAKVTTSAWAAAAVAVFITIALVIYQRSAFSIFVRFRQNVGTRLLSAVILVSPIAGVMAIRFGDQLATWLWCIAACCALAGLSAIFLTRRGDESITPQLARSWQSRR